MREDCMSLYSFALVVFHYGPADRRRHGQLPWSSSLSLGPLLSRPFELKQIYINSVALNADSDILM
jgi:hypothetical protein